MKHTLTSVLSSLRRNQNVKVGTSTVSVDKPVGIGTWGRLDYLRKVHNYRIVNNAKGFTLIEILAVICIILILAAIALPKYLDTLQTAREAAFTEAVDTLEKAATIHILHDGGDAIWTAEGGTKAGSEIMGQHETWYSVLQEWPENKLKTGDFVVEIVGDNFTITPNSYE
jgi:prepilin-type N-terminal cleavage/methylation domain-containing protein